MDRLIKDPSVSEIQTSGQANMTSQNISVRDIEFLSEFLDSQPQGVEEQIGIPDHLINMVDDFRRKKLDLF